MKMYFFIVGTIFFVGSLVNGKSQTVDQIVKGKIQFFYTSSEDPVRSYVGQGKTGIIDFDKDGFSLINLNYENTTWPYGINLSIQDAKNTGEDRREGWRLMFECPQGKKLVNGTYVVNSKKRICFLSCGSRGDNHFIQGRFTIREISYDKAGIYKLALDFILEEYGCPEGKWVAGSLRINSAIPLMQK